MVTMLPWLLERTPSRGKAGISGRKSATDNSDQDSCDDKKRFISLSMLSAFITIILVASMLTVVSLIILITMKTCKDDVDVTI